MSENRLNKWKIEKRCPIFITPDEEIGAIITKRLAELKNEESSTTKPSLWGMVQAAKELIFDIEDEKPIFHLIMFTLDTKRFELVLHHPFDMLVESSTEEIKSILAMALALDVPVYPNNDEVAPILAGYHRDLLIDGFKTRDESGQEVHLKLTRPLKDRLDGVRFLEDMESGEMHPPAELLLMREAVMKEITRREEAARVLASLQLAISELSETLTRTERNENELQSCLSRNPILFGPEYIRIIPKHWLGAEYEMDYALERVSGLVDLVEIEASTHKLFTKHGDPSQALIHAEQQVLNWLSWIERNSAYARESLPGLQQPIGYVIIGRSESLSEADRSRLYRRNIVFKGSIQIMTFDELLQKANNLLNFLGGKQKQTSYA